MHCIWSGFGNLSNGQAVQEVKPGVDAIVPTAHLVQMDDPALAEK